MSHFFGDGLTEITTQGLAGRSDWDVGEGRRDIRKRYLLLCVLLFLVAAFAVSVVVSLMDPLWPVVPIDNGFEVLFENVTLVPMAGGEAVLSGMSVATRDGRIAAVAPAGEVEVSGTARRIDGTGKFLLPGLTDMHVHVADRTDLALFLVNGVTAVRDLGAMEATFRFKDQIEAGHMLGPRLYLSTPMLTGKDFDPLGRTVASAEEAREYIRSVADKVDVVKVKEMDEALYGAILDEAFRLRIPVAAHIPRGFAFDRYLRPGLTSIEHIEEIVSSVMRDNLDSTEAIASTVEKIRAAGVAVTPNLVTYQTIIAMIDEWDTFLDRPQAEFRSSLARQVVAGNLETWASADLDRVAWVRRAHRLHAVITLALRDAGVTLLLGTDANAVGAIPGFSVHDELALLVEAGLTRLEALQAATVNAARVLGVESRAGTIEVGKDADLVLVAANPLDDLSVLRDPVGVMRNGQWLSAEDDLAAIREDARSNQLSLYAAGVRLAEHVVRNY